MLDKFLRENLVHGEISIGPKKVPCLDVLLAVGITVVAVLIRESIFGISENPGIGGGTHMVIYCVLDFVLALAMAFFTWKISGSALKTLGMYSLAVIWPAIAGNSALNGGVEVVYAVILVILLAFIVSKKLYGKASFWCITFATWAFQVMQSSVESEKITHFWPNIYTLFSDRGYVAEYGITGKLLVVGILLIIFYYISKKEFKVTPELLVASGLFVSLLLFIQNKNKFYVPMAMCIISYVSYGYFYNGAIGVHFWIYALGLVTLMLDAGVYFYKQLQTGKEV